MGFNGLGWGYPIVKSRWKERIGGIFSQVIAGEEDEGHIEEVCTVLLQFSRNHELWSAVTKW